MHLFNDLGIKRGRYTLKKKTGCIKELKKYKSSVIAADVLNEKAKYFDDLIKTVTAVDAKYPAYSPELIASIPEKITQTKVSFYIVVYRYCFSV